MNRDHIPLVADRSSANPDRVHLTLSAIDAEHAAEIAGWVRSDDEAKAWAGESTTLPITADHFRRWHRDPEVHPLVGIKDSELIAYGELWVDDDDQEIELARIIVHQAHRGMGFGRSFVESLVAHAAHFELADLFIRVLPGNLAAIRCYQAAGFVAVPPADRQAFNRGQPSDYLWLKPAASA